MIALPDIKTLEPHILPGNIFLYQSLSTRLVKMDLLFEAGTAYQTKKLCASAAVKLCTVACSGMDSAALAEFMDYRGILVETDSQVQQSQITFYFLRNYATELLPLVRGMLSGPAFSETDFETWRNHRRQEILSAEQKPSTMARRDFYFRLFGDNHPLGRYATSADLDVLTVDDVRKYIVDHYRPEKMMVGLAGSVDDELLALVEENLGKRNYPHQRPVLNIPAAIDVQGCWHTQIESATQTNIRVGRILPVSWDSIDYARLMLLTTVLGGYFGSRLMSNLREDKGFTYGIYARTQIYRGVIVFFITADVASGVAKEAVNEIMYELGKLIKEPVPEDELELVKTVLAGDFLRSVDGIFERSARYCDMHATCVTEQLTANLQKALQAATPSDLQQVAIKYLDPSKMLVCTAGV